MKNCHKMFYVEPIRFRYQQWLYQVIVVLWSVIMAPSVFAASDMFLSLADIHFDPFAGCTPKHLPCPIIVKLQATTEKHWDDVFQSDSPNKYDYYYIDTNYSLFKKTLAQLNIVKRDKNPEFVFILGDFLAHDFRKKYMMYSQNKSNASCKRFIKNTMVYLTDKIQDALPDTLIIPVIGNNDSYNGDYGVQPKGAFLQDVSTIWGKVFTDPVTKAHFRKKFSIGGYYAFTLPKNNKVKIIVLNTVLFSLNRTSNSLFIKQAAQAQLNWLHQELKRSADAHQHVCILYHIHTQLMLNSLFKKIIGSADFWYPEYKKTFDAEIKQYANIISAIFPAHIHSETWQFLSDNHVHNVPLYFTPSISPIFGNNPSFKTFSLDDKVLRVSQDNIYSLPFNAGRRTGEWDKQD